MRALNRPWTALRALRALRPRMALPQERTVEQWEVVAPAARGFATAPHHGSQRRRGFLLNWLGKGVATAAGWAEEGNLRMAATRVPRHETATWPVNDSCEVDFQEARSNVTQRSVALILNRNAKGVNKKVEKKLKGIVGPFRTFVCCCEQDAEHALQKGLPADAAQNTRCFFAGLGYDARMLQAQRPQPNKKGSPAATGTGWVHSFEAWSIVTGEVFRVKVTNLADEAFAMDSRRGDWAIRYDKVRFPGFLAAAWGRRAFEPCDRKPRG
eukprot:Skav234678  [mRNA]  locus=scaffold1131:551191:557966:- [translate_table: standard]